MKSWRLEKKEKEGIISQAPERIRRDRAKKTK